MRARLLLTIGLTLVSAGAATVAQAQTITVEPPACVPREQNGLVKASVSGAPGQSLRLYFRWEDYENFYWVAMEPEPGGRYWAVPPKPEKRNEEIEYYAALVDPAGKVVTRSEAKKMPVRGDCQVRLAPRERGVAENLTIGETASDQQGKRVMGFLCDGVVTRINSEGIRRGDDVCRACVIAFWPKVVVPMAAAGVTGVIVIDEGQPVSPSRPDR
jgi:hypothetical protein